MGIEDRIEIRQVTIPRRDGSGARDPANPLNGDAPTITDLSGYAA